LHVSFAEASISGRFKAAFSCVLPVIFVMSGSKACKTYFFNFLSKYTGYLCHNVEILVLCNTAQSAFIIFVHVVKLFQILCAIMKYTFQQLVNINVF